ncbi:MAG: Gfo/Idh/MocA family oxidoreductase [Candidatus Cloacimonetes bacterium]|nr:Gfo/Idh/MocA family oxidoreductase [Candidatus Cloacimonadota bacterium]
MKKIALVGCGRISKRHIEAINETPGVEIALVCDINEERAKETAERLAVPYVTDYRKITGIDVISVLTPSGNHPQHAAEIAESTDATYIVCEKPISLTVREVHELFSRIDKAGKTLLPVYQNRYNPLIVLLKDLIDKQKLGKMYQFICNVLWNRNDAYFDIDWHGTQSLDGGVLYTQASHYVDMVHYLFGELVSGKGQGGSLRNLEVYDTVSAVMRFNSGIVGSLNTTVNAYKKNYETEFTLIAEKGIIRLAGTNLNTISHWDVEGIDRPDMDFKLDHIYGKGHNTMYEYIAQEKWDKFPSREDILSGIHLMEKLSY